MNHIKPDHQGNKRLLQQPNNLLGRGENTVEILSRILDNMGSNHAIVKEQLNFIINDQNRRTEHTLNAN